MHAVCLSVDWSFAVAHTMGYVYVDTKALMCSFIVHFGVIGCMYLLLINLPRYIHTVKYTHTYIHKSIINLYLYIKVCLHIGL